MGVPLANLSCSCPGYALADHYDARDMRCSCHETGCPFFKVHCPLVEPVRGNHLMRNLTTREYLRGFNAQVVRHNAHLLKVSGRWTHQDTIEYTAPTDLEIESWQEVF